MSNTLGRISGPMLKANLERFGVDLAFENDLLYLDVNNNKIGVNTSTAPRELTINGDIITTNLIVDNGLLQVADVIIDGSTGNISTVGNVPIVLDPSTDQVTLSILKTPNIIIDNNTIGDVVSNESLILKPHGSGKVSFGTDDSSFTDTLVRGDLHTNGDITLDGDISFGDSSLEDAIQINGELGSDITPTVTDLYDLGSPTKKWLNVHTRLINGELLTTTNFSVPGITNIATRPGNTWYVSSENGDDTNVGDHQMGPYRTVKHALSQASAGDMVYIYAGEYEEYFPLTVPKGVTVQGESIRGVKVYPHTSNNDKDAFLLNGETTVENLTVADFYYNNTNDTGYAFRFINNFQVDERSPYVRNISVITKSDSSTESAGRGALVDGSVATQYSKEASMLFHSVTFITPGSIALYMKNGVRVEWLNSFTYFASKGLYAQNGAFGRLTPDGSTIKYGAELRSIGSANVYGDVGAEADGNSCLMYLINHNFAYVGAGTDVENDPTLVDQTKETIEVSGGKIYYQSSDQSGDFRVGEAFVVEQDTGFITANGIGGGAQGASNISFSDGTNNTEIDASSVDTGNIQLTQNNVNTVGGDLNVTPASGQTTLDSNATIQDTLTVDGNMVVTGAISFGDSTQQGASTTFSFNAPVSIDIEPTFTKTYNIGSDALSWKNVYSIRYTSDDINIFQNKIYTTTSSSNLELDASGTGRIVFNSPLVINNNFTGSNTSLQDVGITGSLLHTGDLTQTGDKVVTGDYTLSGFLNLNDIDVPFDQISIEGNKIRTTESNADLELTANGTGIVTVPQNNIFTFGTNTIQNNVNIENNLDIINGSLTADTLLTDGLEIFQNNITNVTNADIELRTSGTTDKITLDEDVDVTQDLTANSGASITLSNTVVNGDVTLTGPANYTGNTQIVGGVIASGDVTADSLFLDNVSIDNNVITTTESNSDLEFRVSGTGKVIINNPVTVENTIEVKGALNFNSLTAINSVSSNQFYTDQILLQENFITTYNSNADLELRASGTGTILLSNNNLQIDNNLTVSGDTTLQNLSDRQTSTVSLDNTLYNPNAYDTAVGDRFGWTTAMSNNYIIVGAYQEDDADGTNSGKAYIFDKTTGNLLHTLDNPNPPSGWSDPEVRSTEDRFAWSVAISDSYAVVGAPQEDESPSAQLSGKAYIFDVITGNLLHTLNSTNETQFDQFGWSVAVNGNKVIVSAVGERYFAPTSRQGAVYVFDATTGSLLQKITVQSSDPSNFGDSLASSDSYFIVGFGGTEARIFDINTYSVLHTLTNPLAAGGDTLTDFGDTLDITDKYAIVGAPYQDGDPGDNQGKAYIYDVATGSLLHTLDHPEPGPNDRFSFSVAISDTYAVVGTPYLDDGADGDTGKVYVFDVSTGLLLHTIDNPNIGYNKFADRFGFSVAISGNTFIASAPEEDVTEEGGAFVSSSGVAYVYNLVDSIEPVAVPVEVNVTGTITQTGDKLHTGNITQTGNISTGYTTIDGYLQSADIRFETNYISTTVSDSNLELRANGTGKIVSDTDVNITQNLTVVNDIFANDVNITNTLTIDRLEENEIILDNNYITTSTSNADLELRASGTGSVLIDDDLVVENNVDSNNLTVSQTVVTSTTQINGTVLQNGNTVRNGTTTLNSGITVNNSLQFENIKIDDNLITTTDSNSDLELRAAGTGQVLFDTNVTVNRNIEVLGDVNLAGDFTVSRINFNSITDGDILIDDNFITTTLSNSNLELRANGTGILLFDSNNIQLDQNLNILSNTDINDTVINGTLTHNGYAVHTGNYTNNGKLNIGSNFVTNSTVSFDNIQFFNNVIRTSESNGDLELRADGTGKIVTTSETRFDFNLNVDGTATVNDLTASSITANTLQTTDDIRISGNTIQTTVSNSNLEFRSSTETVFEDLEFVDNIIRSKQTNQNIVISPAGNLDLTNTNIILPKGATSSSPNQSGEVRYDTTLGKFVGFVAGAQPFGGVYSSDLQTSLTVSDSRFYSGNGTINFTVDNVDVGHIDSRGITVHGLKVDNVTINGNTVSSVIDQDINITPNGTGTTILDDTTIQDSEFTNLNTTDPMTLATTANGYVKFNSTTGVVMPAGDNSQRPANPEIGEIRYNNQQGTPEVWNGTTWATWAGNSVTATEAEIDEISNIFAILLG